MKNSVLRAVGSPVSRIPIVGADHHEADDVIGTLATGAGMPVDVVTGDRDLFQLIDDAAEVRVLYTARGVGKHERMTEASVVEKYAVLPSQYADFATMRGDSSDGLPGVAGIGDKTAASLLLKFGDLAGIIAAAKGQDSTMAPGPRRKILDALDYLAVAPTVVEVVRDLDLGSPDLSLPTTPVHPEVLRELAETWGLDSPVARLTAALDSRDIA